jgi:uncharacterized protein (DUF305 family)
MGTEETLMKINIGKKDGIYLVIIGLIILIALRVFNSDSGSHMMGDSSAEGMNNSQSASDLEMNEYMFAEMMIPHHQQAVDMSDLALKKSTNPKILDLAQRIKSAQSSEIIQMQSWLGGKEANSMMTDHSGHSMGGMLTEEEFSKLESSSGVTFDTLFLEGMIAHHEGAIDMAQMIKETTTQEVNAFGLNVVEVQSEEIREMKEILESL